MRYNAASEQVTRDISAKVQQKFVQQVPNTQYYVKAKVNPSSPTPTWQNSPKAENIRGTIDYVLKDQQLKQNLSKTPLGNPPTKSPTNVMVRGTVPSSGVGVGVAGVVINLATDALLKQVSPQYRSQSEAREQLLERLRNAFPENGFVSYDSVFASPALTQKLVEELEQREQQTYLDRELAKPEIRRKIYDSRTQSSASLNASGGGYQGRMNSANPTAGTRSPSMPAYTPPIPDASFPSGYVPPLQKDYPPFQPLNPGGENPANDFKAPSPEEFLRPRDPLDTRPRNPILTNNGNLPAGFEPAPQSGEAVQPGQTPFKNYYIEVAGITGKITNYNEYYGTSVTNSFEAGGSLVSYGAPGKIGGLERVVIDSGTRPGGGSYETVSFRIRVGIGTPREEILDGGTYSADTGTLTGSLSVRPTNPNDPDLPTAQPQPSTRVPVNPDTGSPSLPEIDLKPSINAPTSPAKTPTPSPRNSPSGQPSPVPRPDATPTLNPGFPLPFIPFPLPQIGNPLTPKSPSSPLSNPSLPLSNPATPPSTGNPVKNLDLPGTNVTIDGKPVQNGNTPINQIQAKPQINPTKTPTNVTGPDGKIDPSKVQQQQQQKQPQIQPTPSRNTCSDPCIQGLQDSATSGNDLLQKIAQTVGVDAFPVRAQLLSDSGVSGMETYRNLAELAVWNTKNVDAVTGLFPLEIPIVDESGKESNVKIESVSHAFYELFSLLKVIAEDADAAVNVGSRAIIEAIQSKIAARQAGEYAKGNAKFLGYLGQGKVREIKLTVTPSAAGADNKLQNQEIKDFLEPSTQTYVGWECLEKVSLLPIVQRTLEDGEIARSALYHPFKEGKKPEQSTIPGTSIKYDKKHIKAQEKAWEQFKEDLKKEGKIIDDKKGQTDVKS
jgi:hypothetical protein